MKCMHCLIEFHPQAYNISIGQDIDGHWRIAAYYCPSCRKVNLYLLQFEKIEGSNQLGELISETLIHPRGSHRPPCPPEVPIDYANDYTKACITLPDSSKASAALSRRCLQSLLRETVGVKKSDLAEVTKIFDLAIGPVVTLLISSEVNVVVVPSVKVISSCMRNLGIPYQPVPRVTTITFCFFKNSLTSYVE